MTNGKPTHILARLEIGFRTDSARLKALEQELAVTLLCARQLGKKHGASEDWDTQWSQQWVNIEGILHRITVLLNEMDDSVESSDPDRLKRALAAWETIQAEDAILVEALSSSRIQASGQNAAIRKDGEILAGTLESHLETIHACAHALRIKLELRKGHSKEDVDRLVQNILAKLPNRARADGMVAGSFEQEYRDAAIELEQEHHKFLGFMDVVKGMLMWIETTKERVQKNQFPKVDPA